MEELKKRILDILYKYSETSYGKGSCGELGDSFIAIDAEDFGVISEEIIKLISEDFEK